MQGTLDAATGKPTDELEGYCIDLIEHLASRIGFSYEIYIVPDGKYGSRQSGEWNGMVNQVVTGVTHSAACFSGHCQDNEVCTGSGFGGGALDDQC